MRARGVATILLLLLPPSETLRAQGSRLPTIVLRAGMVITRSARVAPRTYRFPAPASLDSAVITLRGDSITLDFAGATLSGADPGAAPDAAAGVAIRVEGGSGVRISHAKLRGYKVGILARGTRGLTLSGNDLSYGWKPRLYSLVEHESLLDWLSFHHNEQGEWLRFGAGIYLEDVRGGTLVSNLVEQGMNGLLMTRSDSLWIVQNSFSFNSGVGIGLYRSNHNLIAQNRLDYNVRGYSHGFYRRGQDSADLLIYEQSSGNLVIANSATHGGDGLFLWAGQHTMDTGEGGANDNLFYRNNFSFAPTNGMEATFSRNSFLYNRIEGSDHGLWGGYSFESRVEGNCFVRNRVGIAIEHGQSNAISSNHFDGDSTAISLWANPIEPSDWGYPKHRDTRSRVYQVSGNLFAGNRVGVRATNTSDLIVTKNRFDRVDSLAAVPDTSLSELVAHGVTPIVLWQDAGTTGACGPDAAKPPEVSKWTSWPTERDLFREIPTSPAARMPRSAIIVDEWGPFDWRSPKLWPVDSTRAAPLRLAVLGPQGTWRAVARRGLAALSPQSGRVGDTLSVTPATDSAGDWELTLEYRGGATVTPRGERRAAGTPYRFSYGRFEPAQEWTARFFAWSDGADPRSQVEAFDALLRSTPLLERRAGRLDYEWYRPLIRELPQARWALEAKTTVALPPGEYTLRAISDDGLRVWVDGTLVIDRWSLHESALDFAPLTPGRHEILVRYFQVDGWAEVRLDIVPGRQRSAGSPGPH
jgi:nitrous oxidase accessory protein NosD